MDVWVLGVVMSDRYPLKFRVQASSRNRKDLSGQPHQICTLAELG
jgi:hypothetical protein